jgi:hypothetical protein
MARTIRCTAPDGTKFTRRTDRLYTHAVVSQTSPAALREHERTTQEWVERAAGTRTDFSSWTQEEKEKSAARCVEQLAAVRENVAQGRYTYVTWHQRAELAAKEAAKRNADPRYYTRAVVVTVEEAR